MKMVRGRVIVGSFLVKDFIVPVSMKILVSQVIKNNGMKMSLKRTPPSDPGGYLRSSPTTGRKIIMYKPIWRRL